MLNMESVNNDAMRCLVAAALGLLTVISTDSVRQTDMHTMTMSAESATSKQNDLEKLLHRYHSGEFANRRQMQPVNLMADTETIHRQSQQLEQHWNTVMQHTFPQTDSRVLELLEIKENLLETKQHLDQHNHAAHAVIDQRLERTQQDLQHLGVTSPLEELWIKRSKELQHDQENHQQR